MSRSLPLSLAATDMPQIIAEMFEGEKLVLTSNREPVATVIRESRGSWPCEPGSAKEPKFVLGRGVGKLLHYDPNDDSHLEGWEEYMS